MDRVEPAETFDVVGVGAGFAGLYLLHRVRCAGLSCVILDEAGGVGGTWYWNRYPGARCDVQSVDYSYSFDPQLVEEWTWSEKYATQPEILRYLEHVADRYELWDGIRLGCRVVSATWDDEELRWVVEHDGGAPIAAQHLVMASGCLSTPSDPGIDGLERFAGTVCSTSRWPAAGVDLRDRRVAVIGTGSSGVQSIPEIARQAARLTVFQRTPSYTFPAHNGPVPREKLEQIEGRIEDYARDARRSYAGVPWTGPLPTQRVGDVTEEERRRRFEQAVDAGDLYRVIPDFVDVLVDPEANERYAEFLHERIRRIVRDEQTAATLCPVGVPVGTKRPCLESGYLETFNLPHVALHDVRSDPIVTATPSGIETRHRTYELDVIVLATGFDAVTGAVLAIDIRGRGGTLLREAWRDGPVTHLGLQTVGFPNLFTVTGPGSPSVLANMAVAIEQHVEWITDCITDLRERGHRTIEPTAAAQAEWSDHVRAVAERTLHGRTDSWYVGANVPGKPRVFLAYAAGVDRYRRLCERAVELDYLGFTRTGSGSTVTNEGPLLAR